MAHENSIHAYYQFKHKIKGLHLRIVEALNEHGKMSQSELSAITGIKRHILSGRVNELLFDRQFIKVIGTEVENNNPVNVYDLRTIHDKWNSKVNTKDDEIESLKLRIKQLENIIAKFGGVNQVKEKVVEKTLKFEL